MQMNKKNKNFIRASDKVLKSKSNSTFEDKNDMKGDENPMTSKELYELLEWLKKEGYTLDEVINLIKDIANIR